MARVLSSFSCLSQNLPQTPSYSSSPPVPIIGLVNGTSGGHKGVKVLHILKRAKIPAFDLLCLSTDDAYFDSFIQQFVKIYDNIIMEELCRIKHNKDDNFHFHLHPRILIGGGDGTIAWALSILDRALLDSELLRLFWRRSRIISNISNINMDVVIQSDIKTKLSFNTTISDEFFYSTPPSQAVTHDEENIITEQANSTISPFNNGTNSIEFDFLSNITLSKSQPQLQSPSAKMETNVLVSDINIMQLQIQRRPTDVIVSQILPQPDIDLEIEQKENDEIELVSSASLSAEDEAQIIEEFMNQKSLVNPNLNKLQYLIEKQKTKIKQDIDGEEIKLDDNEINMNDINNDTLSESLVTREELQSVIRQKEHAAVDKKSLDDLRILQGIYDSGIGPAITCVPLGTGNDLSRCLGTGFVYPGSKELIHNLLEEYKKAPLTKLDRWKIQFMEADNETRKNRQTSEMLCYFSVGYEGQIAYKFAQARGKNPKLFDRPWKNKIQYMLSGIGAGMEEAFGITRPLNNAIECYVDDEKLKLPSNTRSLVISNIQSMADGVYFWGKGPATKKDMKDCSEPMLGDGKLEVMAAKGIYKYLQMRVGISHYRRLAQPRKVKIIMKTELPIQIDGESWIESEGVVEIYLLHQVFAVVGKNEPRGIRII